MLDIVIANVAYATRWMEMALDVKTVGALGFAIMMGLSFAWLIVFPCHNMYQTRIEKRWKFLRHNAEWERSWWHLPRSEMWSIAEYCLAYLLPVVLVIEVWWHATKWHGRRSLRRGKRRHG